jgi:hypothetical protein
MAAISAYDVGKKRIIYQNVQHENPHPILTAFGSFAIFRILKFQKEKKLYSNLSFFVFFVKQWSNSGQTSFNNKIVIFGFLKFLLLILLY